MKSPLKNIRTAFNFFFDDDAKPLRVRILFRCIAIALGILHTYAAIQSQSMNADGIAYLDIGDAYFRADWANAINAVWSPLYSWLLGFVNFIFKPSMQWQFPMVHIVNFFIYLFALTCFEFMWTKVYNTNQQPMSLRLSEPLWWSLGYLLFIWTSLSLIQIWSVTPDMLMAALVFIAAGLFVQIRSGDEDHRIFLSLGLILGLGYLSKTFMFSTSLVFLGLTWLVQKRTQAALRNSILAIGAFVLVSLPFILLISNLKGKLTIGEAGTVTYVRHVIGIPFPHWQGDAQLGIIPTHLSNIIHESPRVYEFGKPVGGTYPITTDPSYWYDGIDVQLNARSLFHALLASGIFYTKLFFQDQGMLVAATIALYIMHQTNRFSFFETAKRWSLVIPSIIAFGLYGLVLVSNRYIGVWVLLFWTDILANIQLPKATNNKIWLNTLSSMAILGLFINIILFNLDGFTRLNPTLESSLGASVSSPASPLEVAQTLQGLGIQPDSNVGVIGYAYDSFWARLVHVKIIAEMLEEDATEMWQGDDALHQSVLQSFASAGTKAVIAESVPADVNLTNWHQVGTSNHFIYVFSEKQEN